MAAARRGRLLLLSLMLVLGRLLVLSLATVVPVTVKKDTEGSRVADPARPVQAENNVPCDLQGEGEFLAPCNPTGEHALTDLQGEGEGYQGVGGEASGFHERLAEDVQLAQCDDPAHFQHDAGNAEGAGGDGPGLCRLQGEGGDDSGPCQHHAEELPRALHDDHVRAEHDEMITTGAGGDDYGLCQHHAGEVPSARQDDHAPAEHDEEVSFRSTDQLGAVPEDLPCTYEDYAEFVQNLENATGGWGAEGPVDLVLPMAPTEDGASSSVASAGEPEGWIRRAGKWRHGVDRWHFRDGTLKPPLSNKQALLEPPSSSSSSKPPQSSLASSSGHPSSSSSSISPQCSAASSSVPAQSLAASLSLRPRSFEPRVLPSGYVIKPFDITRPSPPALPQDRQSADEATPVGFWSGGVFVPRTRTPAEQRNHAGGQGRQRQERRAKRVEDWWAGRWTPAWLQQYQRDKQQRDEARARTKDSDTNWEAGPMQPATPAVCTSVSGMVGVALGPDVFGPERFRAAYDDDIGLHSGLGVWGAAPLDNLTVCPSSSTTTSTWWHESCTTSTTTSGSTLEITSLWGEVEEETTSASNSLRVSSSLARALPGDEVGDDMILMQMTNNEEADLRQLRMSDPLLQRLELLLSALADHQEEGRGPMSRWALACVIRRAHHTQDLLEHLIRVLRRRLEPRGYWPIVRVPRDRAQANQMYAWARHFGRVVQECAEECFQLPLDVNDFEEADQLQPVPSSTSSEVLDSGSSQVVEQAGDSASSSRRTRSRSPTPARRGSSSMTPHSDSNDDPEPPPPLPLPVIELQGIWREPEVETAGTLEGVGTHETEEDDVISGVQLFNLNALDGGNHDYNLPREDVMCASSTTSTTSTTPTLEDTDAVRDTVNALLVQGSLADTREVINRLLARLRYLRRLQVLVECAIEESLRWIPVSVCTRAWNARHQEAQIWQHILRVGDPGSRGGDAAEDELVHVLLQPNLPDIAQTQLMLPQVPRNHWGALRRRLWREHVRGFGRAMSPSITSSSTNLFMLQVDDSVSVNTAGLEGVFPDDPYRGRPLAHSISRRRGHVPRPPPRTNLPAQRDDHGEGQGRPTPPRRETGREWRWRSPSERRERERSRSRDP